MSFRRLLQQKRQIDHSTTIEPRERRQIEHRRLRRMFESISEEPSDGERARLRALLKNIDPKSIVDKPYIGTLSTPLDADNLSKIEIASFASLMPIGIDALMARVTVMTPAQLRTLKNVNDEEPIDVDADRYDTMIFVTPDHVVRAVKHILVQNETKRLMFAGRLVLRMIELSEDVRLRINTAHNVHVREYLNYYTNLDEEAARQGVDIRGDAHQQLYDKYYEVAFAANDCLHVQSRMTNKSYLERVTLVHNLTETNVAQDSTQAVKRRMEAIGYAVKYAGGEDAFQMTVFLLPIWRIRDIRAAMHAVPACLQGCAIDGVVFNPNETAFVFGRNELLLHYSPDHHTLSEEEVVKYVAALAEKNPTPNERKVD